MTTTMDNMGKVIEQLKMEGSRENFKIMVGGGPVSQSFADKIGQMPIHTTRQKQLKKRRY